MESFEYAKLADITSRSACPRCDGYGFLHSSVDKHDKPKNLRCKRCVDCNVCETSGITVGVVKCFRCHANGFYHNPIALHPHQYGEFVKCFDCLDCKDCLGIGVLDHERYSALKKVLKNADKNQNLKTNQNFTPELNLYPPLLPSNAPFTVKCPHPHISVLDANNMHPHIKGILGTPITPEYALILNSIPTPHATTAQNLMEKRLAEKSSTECPKCLGVGYNHTSLLKHDTKKSKCKHCLKCIACSGKGRVRGKTGCNRCETRGFIHVSTEQSHDVDEKFRCFFCKDCPECSGIGVC